LCKTASCAFKDINKLKIRRSAARASFSLEPINLLVLKSPINVNEKKNFNYGVFLIRF
jgi:hypothetical protein